MFRKRLDSPIRQEEGCPIVSGCSARKIRREKTGGLWRLVRHLLTLIQLDARISEDPDGKNSRNQASERVFL